MVYFNEKREERRKLEQLVDLTPQHLIDACQEEQCIGVIAIPCEGEQATRLQSELRKSGVLRKTDIVRESYGVVQVLALTDSKGLNAVYNKVKAAVEGVFPKTAMKLTSVTDPKAFIEGSDALKLALGITDGIREDAVYLSNKPLESNRITEYLGLIEAINPNLPKRLEVMFAYSPERSTRFECVRKEKEYSISAVRTLDRMNAEPLAHEIKSSDAIIYVDKGDGPRYDKERKEVVKGKKEFYN